MSTPSARTTRTMAFGHGPRSRLDDLIFRFRARRILGALPETVETVADLGSGHDYRLLRYLVSSGRAKRGIAVDITLDTRQSTPGVTLLQGNLANELEIDDDAVDVALSVAVLEHLDDPLLHLSEARRILRPGGALLLTSPAPSSQRLLEFLAYRLHVIDEHEIRDHRRYYGEADIHRLLNEAGFPPHTLRYRKFLLGFNQLATASKA